MTTAELIASHLGPDWWDRTHDDTALLALLDRIMEEYGWGPGYLASNVAYAAEETARRSGCKSLSLWIAWYARIDTLFSPKVT